MIYLYYTTDFMPMLEILKEADINLLYFVDSAQDNVFKDVEKSNLVENFWRQ